MAESQEGIALVIAILVAGIMSAMTLALVTSTVTEKGITQNQRFATQALYNADAAIEVAKQQMAAFSKAKMETLRSNWSGIGPIITSPSTFFPADGLTYHSDELGFEVTTTFTFIDSLLESTSQTFNFHYQSVATGWSFLSSRKQVISEGTLRVSASRGTFADFLIFTHVHYTPNGGAIWFHTSGYFDGRVHSNGKLRFAYFPTFEDLVTCVPQRAVYYNKGNPKELDADRNGNIDVPNFYGGFRRGVDEIPLPPNSFSQERAALGLASADTTEVPLSVLKTQLGLDPYDPSPVPPGIYFPSSGSTLTGGIYIVGNVTNMRLTVDQDGFQNYTMTDQNGVTKRIVLDRIHSKTKVYSGPDSTIYNGHPRGIIYSTGTITNLGGSSRVDGIAPPAIEEDTQLTITARGDIIIDRDIAYEKYTGADCVLGIYSSDGNVRIATTAPNELLIDAFVIATGPKGAFTVDNYNVGEYRGQVHLRGGAVQRYYGPFGTFGGSKMTGYGRDFRYDRRGIAPPYYPLTTVFKVDQPVPHTTSWREV
ncbi:MAG: DUF4900 domain-containing protein [bacterium]